MLLDGDVVMRSIDFAPPDRLFIGRNWLSGMYEEAVPAPQSEIGRRL
jgi:hypothetical protein